MRRFHLFRCSFVRAYAILSDYRYRLVEILGCHQPLTSELATSKLARPIIYWGPMVAEISLAISISMILSLQIGGREIVMTFLIAINRITTMRMGKHSSLSIQPHSLR
ncbi:MAG: hypothetical protein RBG13Loki_2186 [Promethearchaeota archaeon CR_4]|nr:MAG: hypothetical protein RBG13Loki_2186 [Candidatus Lokiarchaeota archaeon CR_4]